MALRQRRRVLRGIAERHRLRDRGRPPAAASTDRGPDAEVVGRRPVLEASRWLPLPDEAGFLVEHRLAVELRQHPEPAGTVEALVPDRDRPREGGVGPTRGAPQRQRQVKRPSRIPSESPFAGPSAHGARQGTRRNRTASAAAMPFRSVTLIFPLTPAGNVKVPSRFHCPPPDCWLTFTVTGPPVLVSTR